MHRYFPLIPPDTFVCHAWPSRSSTSSVTTLPLHLEDYKRCWKSATDRRRLSPGQLSGFPQCHDSVHFRLQSLTSVFGSKDARHLIIQYQHMGIDTIIRFWYACKNLVYVPVNPFVTVAYAARRPDVVRAAKSSKNCIFAVVYLYTLVQLYTLKNSL